MARYSWLPRHRLHMHRISRGSAAITFALLFTACAPPRADVNATDFVDAGRFGERIRVYSLEPGITATVVAPARVDARQRFDLIFYALPNGNSTAETMGKRLADGVGWRYDIQNIAAQTRALRTRGLDQAIVVYLEAEARSWPEWRRRLGYDRANARIVGLIDHLRSLVGSPDQQSVILTGHSGGGSLMFGFIEGQDSLPSWLERIAFLDANYNYDARHRDKIATWLRRDAKHALVVLAYDDREIMLDGKKVVSDSGGTWRASQRMLDDFRVPFALAADTLGEFLRYQNPQVDILLHPNPRNRILHTEMIGEMNGYMHALLTRRPDYARGATVLTPPRAYTQWSDEGSVLPAPSPPAIPRRADNAMTGSVFIASVASMPRDEREAAIRRELFAGNVPSFLRALRPVEATITGSDGIQHTIVYQVMPDYLAIGSDDDFVRMPMNPYTAQAFCDAFGFVLPTRKMVNDIWAAAPVHIEPRPLTIARDSAPTFFQHHQIIEEQLKGKERGVLVAGIKKDVVISNKLLEKTNRVAIYGWHYLNGQPIQPVYAGHVDWYVDYSHGIRPVQHMMRLDGVLQPFERILRDATLRDLVSDEGEITAWRYDRL